MSPLAKLSAAVTVTGLLLLNGCTIVPLVRSAADGGVNSPTTSVPPGGHSGPGAGGPFGDAGEAAPSPPVKAAE